jgi:hypothetical protein
MSEFKKTPWGNARMSDAIRILGGVDRQTTEHGRLVQLSPARVNELQAEIEEMATNYEHHSKEVKAAPRMKTVIKNLDEMVARASALAALFESLDEWTLRVLHEPLGPTGTLQMEGLESEALSPHQTNRGLEGLRIWAADLKTLSRGARVASRSLKDIGGKTNLGIESVGTGRTFLVLNCVGLLRKEGQAISFAVGGNVERLAHATMEFAHGEAKPVPSAAVRKVGENEADTRNLEAAVRKKLGDWNRISCQDLEHCLDGTPMPIPPPPSPEDAEDLLRMAQALTRRQLGAFD